MEINHIGSNVLEFITKDKNRCRESTEEQMMLTILFSYSTPVAVRLDGPEPLIYKTNQFYSKTTTKHINAWLKNDRNDCIRVKVVNQELIDSYTNRY